MKNTKKRAEGYVDVCVGVLVFVMVLVTAINLFGFVTLRIEMDQIADELIQSAAFEGAFADGFLETDEAMREQYGDYELDYGAEEYFNLPLHRVQLGDRMWVTVTVTEPLQGFGVIRIPVTLTVKKSGLSERYWK